MFYGNAVPWHLIFDSVWVCLRHCAPGWKTDVSLVEHALNYWLTNKEDCHLPCLRERLNFTLRDFRYFCKSVNTRHHIDAWIASICLTLYQNILISFVVARVTLSHIYALPGRALRRSDIDNGELVLIGEFLFKELFVIFLTIWILLWK